MVSMNASVGSLRAWWLSPPRSGAARLIAPYEYRHLRSFSAAHIIGGAAAAAAGLICFCYSAYGWAAFFLGIGVLHLAGGIWFLNVAHKTRARP